MKAVLFVCGVLVMSRSSFAQRASTALNTDNGTVCVLPNSSEAPTRISPGGAYNPASLALRINKRESIPWPHKKPILIDGLDTQGSHLVVLTSDGKRVQSFQFKFGEYHDARLCISYDGYQGVQLGNRTDALWCKVESRRCWQ